MAYRRASGRNEEDDSAESTARTHGGSGDEAVGAIADKVDLLVSALQDTNSNLRSVDRLLDTYRALNEQQSATMDRVRDDVDRVASRNGAPLRAVDAYSTNNEMRKYMSVSRGVSESRAGGGARSRNASASLSDVRNVHSSLRDQARSATSSSRFVNTGGPRTISSSQLALSDDYDPNLGGDGRLQDESLHTVHRALRDLTSQQTRLRHELDSEMRTRRPTQSASEMNLRDLVDRFRRDEQATDGPAATGPDPGVIQKQLAEISQELRSSRNIRASSVTSPTRGLTETPAMSSALKSALDAHQGLQRAASSHALLTGPRSSYPYAYQGAGMGSTTLASGALPPGGYAAYGAAGLPPQPALQASSYSLTNLANPYATNPVAAAIPASTNTVADATNDAFLKSKILQLERQKLELENEVDGLKRKLGQAESVRQSTQKQLEESQAQLRNTERERDRARAELTESREEGERKAQKVTKECEDDRIDERRKYDREITALRQRIEQLLASSAAELNEARREQDRLTFANKHANEQIASLREEIESRDRAAAKLANETLDRDAKRSAVERQLAEAQARIATLQEELRQSREAHARLADQLKATEHTHTEALRNENEARQKTHDHSKQLKAQVSKAEKDLDEARRRNSELARRCEAAAAENEQLRRQVAHIQVTFEQLKHEFDNLLTIRGKQEEAIRAKDDEVDRLRAERSEFENTTEAARRSQERAEQQLLAIEHEMNALREELVRVQEKFTATEAARRVLDDQLKSYQADVKQAQVERSQLLASNQQLTLANTELRNELSEQTAREKTARLELATLATALDQEKDKHNTALIRLTREIESIKNQERRTLDDASKAFREQEAAMAKQFARLNFELSEARKHGKSFQARSEQQQVELMNMHERLIKAEQDVQAAQRKYRKLSELHKERIAHERGADETERTLKDRVASLERERGMLIDTVSADIDRLMAKADSQALFNVYRSSSGDAHMEISSWLADTKAKLSHVHAELERLREAKDRLERGGHTLAPEDDTGYTSASPMHSVSTSGNDPLSIASSANSHSHSHALALPKSDAEPNRKLEAIENEISVLLRDLDENRKKQKSAAPVASEPKAKPHKHAGSLRDLSAEPRSVSGHGRFDFLVTEKPSASAMLERQRIANRYNRLQDSVQALKNDLAVDDSHGLPPASPLKSAYRSGVASSRKAQTGSS